MMSLKVETGHDLDRHATEFARDVRSDNTGRRRKYDLTRFLEWDAPKPYTELDALDVKQHFRWMLREEEYAESTVQGAYWNVKGFYERLEVRGLVDESPFESDALSLSDLVKVSSPPKKEKELKSRGGISYITAEEVDAMCDHAHVPHGPAIRNELVVRLLFQTGLRRGELVDVRIEDIDREEREIRIHAEKNHLNRSVYYLPRLDPLLDQWLDGGLRDSYITAADSPYLLCTLQTEQISGRTIGNIVRESAEAAGLNDEEGGVYKDNKGTWRKEVTPHVLRASYAVACLKNGMDSRWLQEILGHAEITTTETYLRVIDKDVKEQARRHGPR